MTLNHDMTQKELCIKPYGFLVNHEFNIEIFISEDWYFISDYYSEFYLSLLGLNDCSFKWTSMN